MHPKWKKRFELIKALSWVMLAGVLVLCAAAFTPKEQQVWPLTFGLLLCLPCFLYVYVVTLWHWKDRYRGTHSDLWGALLLIETSGWFKVVYLFRHMIPDMRNSGRYHRTEQTGMPYS